MLQVAYITIVLQVCSSIFSLSWMELWSTDDKSLQAPKTIRFEVSKRSNRALFRLSGWDSTRGMSIDPTLNNTSHLQLEIISEIYSHRYVFFCHDRIRNARSHSLSQFKLMSTAILLVAAGKCENEHYRMRQDISLFISNCKWLIWIILAPSVGFIGDHQHPNPRRSIVHLFFSVDIYVSSNMVWYKIMNKPHSSASGLSASEWLY